MPPAAPSRLIATRPLDHADSAELDRQRQQRNRLPDRSFGQRHHRLDANRHGRRNVRDVHQHRPDVGDHLLLPRAGQQRRRRLGQQQRGQCQHPDRGGHLLERSVVRRHAHQRLGARGTRQEQRRAGRRRRQSDHHPRHGYDKGFGAPMPPRRLPSTWPPPIPPLLPTWGSTTKRPAPAASCSRSSPTTPRSSTAARLTGQLRPCKSRQRQRHRCESTPPRLTDGATATADLRPRRLGQCPVALHAAAAAGRPLEPHRHGAVAHPDSTQLDRQCHERNRLPNRPFARRHHRLDPDCHGRRQRRHLHQHRLDRLHHLLLPRPAPTMPAALRRTATS